MPSDGRPKSFLHSAALRGALWITLIALLATGAALTLQYVQTTRLLAARSAALVEDETTALVARWQSDGPRGLAAAIDRQRALPRLNEFFYLYAAPDGTPLAGNLLAWPDAVTAPGFHSFRTAVVNTRGTASQRWVDASAVMLEDGTRLLVGSFADERAALQGNYLSALFWSLLATGVLGLGLGWWYSRRGLGFVEIVSATGQRFLAGRLDERLPVSQRNDDYDRLAVTINACFAEVERLVGSLRATTDGMAHDLKTPLTRIRARLELADMGNGDMGSAATPDLLAETRRDLDTVLTAIDGALGLARAEATATASFERIDIAEIARETLELYQPLAEDKGLTLDSALLPASIDGSRTLIAQMIANLVDNAIKFTPAGGAVRVATTVAGDAVSLLVSDTGPGIPAADRDRALARFGRLDRDTGIPGSGLGLGIVAVAARVHRAQLMLGDAAPGLRVEVRFPRTG